MERVQVQFTQGVVDQFFDAAEGTLVWIQRNTDPAAREVQLDEFRFHLVEVVAVVVVGVAFGSLEEHLHHGTARQAEALRNRTDGAADQRQLGARLFDHIHLDEPRVVLGVDQEDARGRGGELTGLCVQLQWPGRRDDVDVTLADRRFVGDVSFQTQSRLIVQYGPVGEFDLEEDVEVTGCHARMERVEIQFTRRVVHFFLDPAQGRRPRWHIVRANSHGDVAVAEVHRD